MTSIQAAVFDVDGVLVDSPHEEAWRQSLHDLMDGPWASVRERTTYSPELFTSELYRRIMSGLPRADGARAALEYFGVPDLDARTEEYGRHKQELLVELISAGRFSPYDDAINFLVRLSTAGVLTAAASSSKNAGLLLSKVSMSAYRGNGGSAALYEKALVDVFDADVSGRDFARGKPSPDIFEAAVAELGTSPGASFVVEDAVNGVQAAKAAGCAVIAVARADDADSLRAEGPDLVVTTLDEVDVEALLRGEFRKAGG